MTEDNITNTDAEDLENTKAAVNELLKGASPERLQAMHTLLSLSDARAVIYGDALSLLIDTEYNVGTLKQAISNVKDEQGLQMVRTRTAVRVFKYLEDEDNPAEGFKYRAFYVNTITPEQKIAIGVGNADRLKEMLKSSFTEKNVTNDPKKMLEFINSESFRTLMTEPNKIMRDIVLENMTEVIVDKDGVVEKPLNKRELLSDCQEFILLQLEEDLGMLIEQQGILAKNSLMTAI